MVDLQKNQVSLEVCSDSIEVEKRESQISSVNKSKFYNSMDLTSIASEKV